MVMVMVMVVVMVIKKAEDVSEDETKIFSFIRLGEWGWSLLSWSWLF